MDSGMVQMIVFGVAPKGWLDGSLKAALFTAAIVATNGLVVALVTGAAPEPVADSLVAAIVGAPFVAGSLALGRYHIKLKDRLTALATTDMLTGLPNRRSFMERARARDAGVLLMIDADHFKRINDTHGHAAGDLCLQAIARRLREVAREGDILGRLGGEEFAAFLVPSPAGHASEVARRLTAGVTVSRVETETPGPTDGMRAEVPVTDLDVSLSVGMATLAEGETLDDLLKRADRGLYAAKNAGRRTVRAWPPHLAA